ncbi:T9SS type B sorting domain-containing protein [Flavobacterium sp. ZB4P23]|uniref:PKD-like domain-containing protein n=1 Tax=Flavobacterium sp. ZB4P23 TaxID=2497484 RepID=UPI000F834CA3|nr:PKD-like domain-containing protein [Flavobacterium sp. ZB4P23]RTY83336.1 T9SS type B sorting domain-containing protein [Flavobacterium sp. ZB4P23]
MKHFYKILFLFIFLFTAIYSVNSQTINLIRFNNTANYTAGSGVSVIVNPTGIFQLDNQFILELSNVGGIFPTSPTILTTLNEFYAPVMNGTLPAGLPAGTYKLRVRATTGLGTTPETYPTEETLSFNIVPGSSDIPSATSDLTNNSSFFNCTLTCLKTTNIFGSLTQSSGATSNILPKKKITVCNYLNTDNYKITLIDVINGTQTLIAYNIGNGEITIPDNLAIGTYVFEIEKNSKSVYSLVFLFHGNGTSLGNSTSEVVCVGVDVSFTVDVTNQGIGRNYSGSKYRVDFGDSSPVLELTQAELMANPTITHTFTSVSCAKTDGNFIIKETLLNKGVYNGGANANYCTEFYKNGNGVEKKVNVSLAPKAEFLLSTKQCINLDIIATNKTMLGSYGSSGTCLDKATFTWYYKKPGDVSFTEVKISSWIDSSNNLKIPKALITIPGCWEIKLTAINDDLCQTVSEVTKTIKIEISPTATFTNTPETPICPNTQIQFTNTSNVINLSCQEPIYLWTVSPSTGYQFVSPSNSASKDPEIVFTDPGIYTVKLSVTNSCGTVVSTPKIIEVLGSPTVSFSPNTISICNQAPPNYTIDFSQVGTKPNYSVAPYAPTSFLWSISGSGVTASDYSFIGGTTANSQFPKINVTTFKTYNITVVVNGNCAGSGQATFTFTLNKFSSLIVTDPLAVCSPGTVDITVPAITLGSDNGLIYSYWTNASATTAISAPSAITVSGTYYIKATNTNGCSIIKPVTVVVNALPVIGGTLSTCIGASSQLSGTATASTTSPWSSSNPAVASISDTGLVTAFTSGTTIITYTNSNGCQKTETFTVSINPSIITPQNQTICSSTAFSIVPSDGVGNIVPVGTTYSWSAPVVTGGITGGAALVNQTTIKGTLINPTNDVQTATYTITPKSGTCTGPTFTVIITVNPSPKVQFSGVNQTLCSGSDSSLISLSSPTTGNVTFNWTATIPAGISGATPSGTDTIATQTLVNSTTNPLTVIYTATATFKNNAVSCSGVPLVYKITVSPAIITSSIPSNFNGFNVSTIGASDGAINVTVTGGSGAYTYLWSGPSGFSASSQDISLVPAGAYSLTINDGLCNPVILNFTLTAPLALLIQEDTAAQINVLCFGYLTGAIKVDVTQQSVGPYDYLLTLQGSGTINSIVDSAATTYTFTGLGVGIYDIKITDANGSVKTISGIVITQPDGITASISYPTNISCAGSATGSATVTASGGVGTLTYSWNTNPIQTTATASGLKAGTYTVTITDANTCSIQKQVMITEPNGIITSITSQTNVFCFGDNTGSATVSATGGTGTLTYSWDTIPIQTTATTTGLVVGTYNVTITDANGCSKVQTVLITQPSAGLTAMISNSTNVSCFGGNNGNATVLVTGGTSPYSYSWNTSPIQTSATAIGLKAGTYNVTVTDAKGCIILSSVTITEPAGMSATITAQTDVLCSGNSTGSATVTATGGTAPFSYSWNTTPVQTSAVAINLTIGTYTATITDAKGCTTAAQATITEPNGIIISIASQTNVNCFENNTGAVTVLASGGTGILTYSWDTIPVQTSLNATGLIAGTYHLTVTDAKNCSKVQTVNITQPDDIGITTDLEKDITCFNAANGEIKITITGGTLNYNYAWTKDGISYATTDDISNLSPGIYKVTVSDANNCNPKTATFTITEPPVLAVSLISQTNILCYGESTGAIQIAVVGGTPTLSGYSFAWTGPNGFTSSNKNLTATSAGTYNVQVTDNSGCSKVLSVTLTQPTAIVLSATTTPIICYGSNDASIRLVINGGLAPYRIVWSNLGSGTFQDNLTAGDYLITITDSNNCVKTLNVNIPEAPIFTINPVVKNISCFGAQDGSINLNIIGGIAPVKLVWDDSSVAGNVRNNLKTGSYTVTIVDGKPCAIKKTFIILEPQPLILSANTTNAFDCDNANSGTINLLVAGGTPPFTYSWSNGSTTEDLVNIPAGNYLVTVTDSRGCSKQAQYSINRPPPIVIGVATKTEFDCETKYVKQNFVAQVSGGVPPYQLSWSNGTVSGSNNEIMNTSQNGTAILYVTDALGCKANYSFNVKLQSLGTPSFNVTSYSYLTYGSYSIMDPIQFTNTATGDYISMIWDFSDGSFSTDLNPVHTFINPKEYTVTQTVTYPFGCIYVQKISFIVEKGYVLVVPTAFTPNNDIVNDTFRPVAKTLKNVRLDIYDTWGSLIYSETGDTLKGWDGKIKGQNAENGNYYCKVSAETFYGTIVTENHPFVVIK